MSQVLLAVDEFEQVAGDTRAELLGGVIVQRPAVKFHYELQSRIFDLVRSVLEPRYAAFCELEYRTASPYTMPKADVAAVEAARWDAVLDDDRLMGAPELHVEILCDEDRYSHLLCKRRIAMNESGCQFWVVDPAGECVDVTGPNGLTREYRCGDRISLAEFGAGEIEVSDIFAHPSNV